MCRYLLEGRTGCLQVRYAVVSEQRTSWPWSSQQRWMGYICLFKWCAERLPTHKVTQIVTATPLGTWTELKNSDGVQRMLTKIWGEAHDFLLNLNCFNSISITLTSSKIYILGGFFTWFLWLDLIIFCWNCLWKLRGCN